MTGIDDPGHHAGLKFILVEITVAMKEHVHRIDRQEIEIVSFAVPMSGNLHREITIGEHFERRRMIQTERHRRLAEAAVRIDDLQREAAASMGASEVRSYAAQGPIRFHLNGSFVSKLETRRVSIVMPPRSIVFFSFQIQTPPRLDRHIRTDLNTETTRRVLPSVSFRSIYQRSAEMRFVFGQNVDDRSNHFRQRVHGLSPFGLQPLLF